jgi:type VI secretion system secreted protein VgrG
VAGGVDHPPHRDTDEAGRGYMGEALTLKQSAERLLRLEIGGQLSTTIIPVAFNGKERLSEIYEYSVDVLCSDLNLDAESILGKSARVIVKVPGGKTERHFDGIVISYSTGPLFGGGYRSYVLVVAPKLWLATLNTAFRSFEGKNTGLDIVQKILMDHGISDKVYGYTPGDDVTREFCVQYAESDYDFVRRIMAEEGVFFYFPVDHDNKSIVLVNGAVGSFDTGASDLRVGPHQALTRWENRRETIPQKVVYRGYDRTQAAIVSGSAAAQVKQGFAASASIEAYSSNLIDEPRSSFLATQHMEAVEARYQVATGDGSDPRFAPGGSFSAVTGLDGKKADQFLLVEVNHVATCHSYVSSDGESSYSNSFTCIPLATAFRPDRQVRRPLISGPQTAEVVSDPDSMGRVKVRFHWGNDGKGVQSWWLRVAMPWANNQMGFQFLPRMGSEVVVQFLDGNPERPIIIGAVYNGQNGLLYKLPDNKTQSGIRGTNPGTTGAAETSNELQFEDKANEEFIKIYAQKDFKRVVVNNDELTVKNGHRSVTVSSGDETHTVKKGGFTVTLDEGNMNCTLKQGNVTYSLDMGNLSVKAKGGACSIEAMQSITLKVGQNSVTIDQSGIVIKGITASVQAQASAEVKGPMTTVKGDGMLTLKGAITMIN